jgi:hypothetical protein
MGGWIQKNTSGGMRSVGRIATKNAGLVGHGNVMQNLSADEEETETAYGNGDSTSTLYRNVEDNPRGIPFTVTGDSGNITSARVRLKESSTNNAHDAQVLIYDNSGNYLGASDVLENGVTTTVGYVDFTFTTPVAVTSSSTYRAYAWADAAGTGDLYLAYEDETSAGRGFAATWPTYPDPESSSVHNRNYAVEVTVTG